MLGGVTESADVDPGWAEVDLLGLLACRWLVAVSRLAACAREATVLADRLDLAGYAAGRQRSLEWIGGRLAGLGVELPTAMAPFAAAVDAVEARTVARRWPESLLVGYIGDGVIADFARRSADRLHPSGRAVVVASTADDGYDAFVVDRVAAAIAAAPESAGRLALWSRRVMGESLGLITRVGSPAGLSGGHAERMRRLGLTA